jgi:hypothetical protein
VTRTRTRTRRAALAALVTAGIAGLTACGYVTTGASEVALQYEGGVVEGKQFYECFGGGVRDAQDWGDAQYYYPTGGRDFTFSGAKTADTAPLTAVSKDAQQLRVTGTVKFSMTLSCAEFTDPDGKRWPGGTAQYFHEKFGTKDPATPVYNVEGNASYGEGWSNFLEQYVGFAVDRIVDDNALSYDMKALRTDPQARASWEADVKKKLPDILTKLTGGVSVFKITEVILQQPEVRKEVADAEAQRQAAVITAEAAEVDKTAAQNWPGGIESYLEYKRQQAVNKAIESGKVQILPVPEGSPIIVQPPR